MGKHSIEKTTKKRKEKHKNKIHREKHKNNNKKSNKAIIMAIIIIFIVLAAIAVYISFVKSQEYSEIEIKEETTIEGKRLVFKSKNDYNKIIEYIFEKDTIKKVIIYEQFEEKEQLEERKSEYEITDDVVIKEINEEELSITIEKGKFGSDTGLNYDQIYDKYLVQIVDAYEKI